MRADDLRLNELLDFSEGWVGLHGRRLVLHDIHAFAQFRKDLVDSVGLDSARRMFTRFGFFWGQADAAAMKRIFKWDSLEELVKAGQRLHRLQGVAQALVKSLELDEERKRFKMEVVWHDSAEAEEHLIELGRSAEPACWMSVGYASGYASFCLAARIVFVEQRCVAAGARACSALGKDLASWGDEIGPHLDYFQAEKIHEKVMFLTRELKKRTEEINQQNKRIQELAMKTLPSSFVEAHSEAYRRVLNVANQVASFNTSILITGETGTGKEVLARYVHNNSSRAQRPFVGVNCGALPETLLESELFGHKVGAFTGATQDRVGLFEEAEAGTIFLDEIGDISQAMQLKILRALQEREIRRVGESKVRRIDVRVIAATNRSLEEEIAKGKFREDLYYRLRVVEIHIPPLRQRREDIVPLARFLVEKIRKKLNLPNLYLDARCVDFFLSYSWPGNVRELENAIEHAAVFSRNGIIDPEHLPYHIVRAEIAGSAGSRAESESIADLEKAHVVRVLNSVNQNRTKAARILGISQTTLWRKLKKWEASG